jgi:hypothetical protein
MMETSREWSKPVCGVTHFRQNNITHTVSVCGERFCEAYKFSWTTYQYSPTYKFFVGDKKLDSVGGENAFYGSKNIVSALDNAKAFLLKD